MSRRGVNFFSLVGWVQASRPGAMRVGYLGERGTGREPECLRLRPALSLAFPARDVEDVAPDPSATAEDGKLRLDVNFGGLYGPDSPLPNVFTEDLLEDEYTGRDLDLEGVRDFLDIFHHRLYSLLFRAWEKHRYHATFERDGSDEVSGFLRVLAGLGTRGLADGATADGALPALHSLRTAGLARHRPRSSGVLRAALRDHLNEPVRVECFVLHRVELRDVDCTYLGGARLGEGGVGEGRVPARRLGDNAVVGDRLRDRSSRIRVRIGPLSRTKFSSLLPGTVGRRALDALIERFRPSHIAASLVMELESAEAAPAALGGNGQLGWSTWLGGGADRAAALPVQFS